MSSKSFLESIKAYSNSIGKGVENLESVKYNPEKVLSNNGLYKGSGENVLAVLRALGKTNPLTNEISNYQMEIICRCGDEESPLPVELDVLHTKKEFASDQDKRNRDMNLAAWESLTAQEKEAKKRDKSKFLDENVNVIESHHEIEKGDILQPLSEIFVKLKTKIPKPKIGAIYQINGLYLEKNVLFDREFSNYNASCCLIYLKMDNEKLSKLITERSYVQDIINISSKEHFGEEFVQESEKNEYEKLKNSKIKGLNVYKYLKFLLSPVARSFAEAKFFIPLNLVTDVVKFSENRVYNIFLEKTIDEERLNYTKQEPNNQTSTFNTARIIYDVARLTKVISGTEIELESEYFKIVVELPFYKAGGSFEQGASIPIEELANNCGVVIPKIYAALAPSLLRDSDGYFIAKISLDKTLNYLDNKLAEPEEKETKIGWLTYTAKEFIINILPAILKNGYEITEECAMKLTESMKKNKIVSEFSHPTAKSLQELNTLSQSSGITNLVENESNTTFKDCRFFLYPPEPEDEEKEYISKILEYCEDEDVQFKDLLSRTILDKDFQKKNGFGFFPIKYPVTSFNLFTIFAVKNEKIIEFEKLKVEETTEEFDIEKSLLYYKEKVINSQKEKNPPTLSIVDDDDDQVDNMPVNDNSDPDQDTNTVYDLPDEIEDDNSQVDNEDKQEVNKKRKKKTQESSKKRTRR